MLCHISRMLNTKPGEYADDEQLSLLADALPILVAYSGADLRERHPDPPIVFISGYSETAAIEKAVGVDTPLLRKPFRVEALHAIIDRALLLPCAGRATDSSRSSLYPSAARHV